MSSIKNINYDIGMLGKYILLLPFVDEKDFKLLNNDNIDSKLKELGLDCVTNYTIDPCPLEELKSPVPKIDPLYTVDITRLYMPDPE